MQNLNKKTARLMEIKSLMTALEKEKKSIEEEFKSSGSFETKDFYVEISETTRYYPKGVEALFQAFGEAAVLAADVVTKSTFKTVRVNKKESAAA